MTNPAAQPTAASPARATPRPGPRGRADAIVPMKNLGVLRGLAISLVVLHHACTPLTWYVRRSGLLDTQPFYWLAAATQVCIPAFVFASGYFMARFSSSWPAAVAGAKTVLWRYVPWTLGVYALTWLFTRRLDPWATLHYAVTGTDRPAWFLVLLVQLFLLTPILLPWVKAHQRLTVGCAVLLQLVASGIYYLRFAGVETHLHHEFVLLQLPFFLLGMLASLRAEAIVAALVPWRRWLLAGLVASLLLCSAEETLLRAVFRPQDDFSETISIMVAAVFVIACVFIRTSRTTRLAEGLNWIGLRSMGLLLVHGYVRDVAVMAFWHFERILGLTTRPRTEVPFWFFGHVTGVVPIFLLSLAVPLAIVEALERLAGKRVRTLVFG